MPKQTKESRDEWKARIGVGEPSRAFRRMDSGPGTSRASKVMRADKPGVAGVQVEHWDGRRDAAVFPEHVRVQGQAKRQG